VSFVVQLSIAKLAPSGGILLLPLPSVERLDGDVLDRAGIEATRVDADPVRVRARHVEGLDAAHRAEQMLCDSSVESVGGQRFTAAHQSKPVGRHDQVQVAGLAADRAVAFRHPEPRGCLHLEPHSPAVTATRVLDHERSPRIQWGQTRLIVRFCR